MDYIEVRLKRCNDRVGRVKKFLKGSPGTGREPFLAQKSL